MMDLHEGRAFETTEMKRSEAKRYRRSEQVNPYLLVEELLTPVLRLAMPRAVRPSTLK